jgi:hypothetical protein
MKKGKVRLQVGNILKIDLGDGFFSFARVLREPIIAFYGIRTDKVPDMETIISSPVLFKIAVMNNAVTFGRWAVIGSRPLEPDLLLPIRFFKQDMISKRYTISNDVDDKEMPATKEECAGLERDAVWSAEHVEDRLRDHFAVVPNCWVESLKLA